jgi:hypothetical protein
MKNFSWLFREFLQKKSPYPLASRLGKSEKLIYAWAQDESSPFYRRDPLSYALSVLRVINDHCPDLAYRALSEIARELGYRLEPYPSQHEKEVQFHQVLRELNDVEESLADPENSLEEDLKEIDEALHVLLLKKAELLKKLEKAEREGKNPSRRR